MSLPKFPEKEPNYNINFQSSVVVNLPAQKFDLAGWLPNFTCDQYVSCTPSSKSHKYSNVYRDGDGGLVYRNDEWVGGFMMTQFYRERIMKPNQVRLVSLTRARLLEVIPVIFPLYWEMKVEPYQGESDRSLFTCFIGADLDPFYYFGSQLTQLLFWSQAHATLMKKPLTLPIMRHYGQLAMILIDKKITLNNQQFLGQFYPI